MPGGWGHQNGSFYNTRPGHLHTTEGLGLRDFLGWVLSYGEHHMCIQDPELFPVKWSAVMSPTPPSQGGGFWAAEKSSSCYYQRPTSTGPNSLYKCPDVQIKKEQNLSPTGRVDGRINSGDAAKSICASHPIISDTLPGTLALNRSVILSTACSCWLRAGVNSEEM